MSSGMIAFSQLTALWGHKGRTVSQNETQNRFLSPLGGDGVCSSDSGDVEEGGEMGEERNPTLASRNSATFEYCIQQFAVLLGELTIARFHSKEEAVAFSKQLRSAIAKTWDTENIAKI
jgi:hypothetical protein